MAATVTGLAKAPPREFVRRAAGAGGWLLAALAMGAAHAVGAYALHPLSLLVAVAAATTAAVTVARPEVGIAMALALAALNPGLIGDRPWLFVTVWVAFLGVVALVRPASTRHGHTLLPPLGFVVLTYGAATLVSFVAAPDTGAAIPLSRSAAVGIALFFLIATQIRSFSQLSWVVAGATAAVGLIGSYATWQYVRGESSGIGFVTSSGELVDRVTAGLGHPNQLAGFLVILVPLALAGARLASRGRLAYLASVAVALVGIYASFSRGALVGLAVIPFTMLPRRWAMVVLPFLAVVAALAMPGLVRERFETTTNQGSEFAGRLDIWSTAGSVWIQRPLLGVGLGGFPAAYAEVRVPGKEFLSKTVFEPPPHAHNLFLQLLAEQGVIGLGTFLAVMTTAGARCLRLLSASSPQSRVLARSILASLAAFLIHNMFDVTLLESTGIYFWAVLGMFSALTTIASMQPRAT